MKDETKAWLAKAEEDLEVAKDMFKLKKYGYTAFWCQQSAEKALKAMQIEKENRFDKVHDLVLLSKKVSAPPEIIEICKKLTIAYTYTRYPDVETGEEDMEKISREFVKDAGEVIRWTKKNL